MSRLVPWLLIASLVVNGFLVGLLAAGRPFMPPPGLEAIVDHFARILPDADARILRQAADREMTRTEGSDLSMVQFRRRMAAIMESDPFDSAGFATLTAEFRRERERRAAALDSTLAAALPRLSLEGRRRLAEMRQPMP